MPPPKTCPRGIRFPDPVHVEILVVFFDQLSSEVAVFDFSRQRSIHAALLLTAWLSGIGGASAQDDAAKLATELANPIASLISVPFQSNYNTANRS